MHSWYTTIYPENAPRTTVPLNRSSSRRMQFGSLFGWLVKPACEQVVNQVVVKPNLYYCRPGCVPPKDTFGGISTIFWTVGGISRYWNRTRVGDEKPFETCYRYKMTDKYCWTRSVGIFCPGSMTVKDYACHPDGFQNMKDQTPYAENPGWYAYPHEYLRTPGDCGDPCPEMCWTRGDSHSSINKDPC